MSTGVAAFVGRAGELERLRVCAGALSSGSGAVVLLEGDAGAGKTRLLEELHPAAAGGALEYVQTPYAPVRDLLLALDRRFPKILKADAPLAAELRALMELRVRVDEPFEQHKLLDAIVRALEKYSAAEPLILAIEDAHWIDRASAAAVAHIARRAPQMRAMFVVTYRGADAMQREESRALVAQLTRFANVVLPLKPLSVAESMVLVDEASDRALPLAVRRSICDLAQGSPLLILELTRHAQQDPARFESGLPTSLQALVHERLALFSETERDVLRVCAALETFDVGLVAEIAGAASAEIAAVLRKARAQHIVDEPSAGRFVFRHALIRRAISDDVLGIELADLHARIAARLSAESASPELHVRLGFHFWMAGDEENTERYNVMAAQDLMRVQAFEDAAACYERAIGGRETGEATYEHTLELAQCYEHAGRYRQAVEAYRGAAAYARSALAPQEHARICIALSRACFHSLDDEGSIAAVRAAIDALGDADDAQAFELWSLLGWYLVHLRRLPEARGALDRAEPLEEHAHALARIRHHEANAAYEVHARNGGEWRAHAERALAIADTLDDATRIHRYTNAMALAIASNLDDFAFAYELYERIRPSLEADPSAHVGMQSTLTWMHYVCGRLDQARRTITVLLPYVQDTAIYAYRAVSVGIPLALRTGDAQLLKSCFRPRLLDEAFASQDPVVYGPVAAAVGEYFITQGRAGEAIALVERTLRRIESAGNNLELLLLAGRIGSENALLRARELLKPWLESSASARAVMLMLDAHAQRGAARRSLALRAAAAFEALPWPLHRAQALELAGEIDAARALYAQTGAAADAARLSRAQTRTGGLPDILSRRETEVAELVAEGRSNRAIAERLSLSERTVENHIGSIFNKLNLRSRVEIAALVAAARGNTA